MIYAGWDLRWLRLLKWIMIWGDYSVFYVNCHPCISTTIFIQNIYNYIYKNILSQVLWLIFLRHSYKLFALLIVFTIQDKIKLFFKTRDKRQNISTSVFCQNIVVKENIYVPQYWLYGHKCRQLVYWQSN